MLTNPEFCSNTVRGQRWQLRNRSVWDVWKVTGRCYLEGVNALPLERTDSLFQPHDCVSRQTKPNCFQDPQAGLVWFLNLATESLTWGRWMWKFCHWLAQSGALVRSGEPCHAAWRVCIAQSSHETWPRALPAMGHPWLLWGTYSSAFCSGILPYRNTS